MAYDSSRCDKTERIDRLKEALFAKMPEIESARAKLITESYQQTEGQPMVIRRSLAFKHILENIPIIIRDDELVVGSTTIAPRGCQTYPEFSYEWLEAEFDTVETREADKFHIEKSTAAEIKAADKYWKGKTTSELALSYMAPETIKAMNHNMFTTGNYFFNGVGHVTVQYWKVLEIGYEGIMKEVAEELERVKPGDANYSTKSRLLQAMLISCKAVIDYANRYAIRAEEMADKETNPNRAAELRQIAANCKRVPAKGATSFYEACQSFWFVQQLLQLESSGHSISPGRFDQYMYPYFREDIK
nr:glycyl radical protein [Pseudobutyrivibrio sp.]